MKKKNYVFTYLILSVFAAFLVLIIVFIGPQNINSVEWWDRLLISGIITGGLLLGILSAFSPGWYKKYFHTEKHDFQTQRTNRKRRGHHPNCTHFQYHTIQIKNKTNCLGCLGLSLGCAISIFILIVYVNISMKWFSSTLINLALIGIILIFFSYAETVHHRRYKIIHILSNVLLVLGFLLITISVFEITGKIIYGLIVIILSILWLDTRIQLSSWRHRNICSNCIEDCKAYQ